MINKDPKKMAEGVLSRAFGGANSGKYKSPSSTSSPGMKKMFSGGIVPPQHGSQERPGMGGNPGDSGNYSGPMDESEGYEMDHGDSEDEGSAYAQGGEVEEGQKAAAEEIMSAFKSGDATQLASALKAFVEQCQSYEEDHESNYEMDHEQGAYVATSGIYTLLQLRTLAIQRANLENSQFVTVPEWNNYVNDSLKELYDLIIQKYGDDYFVQNVSFQTDGSSFLYPLPDGVLFNGAGPFYKFLGLDLALSTTLDSYVTIRSFSFQERNKYAVPNFQSFYGVTNLRYRLQGNNLWLTPIPASGQQMRLWYVPRCVTLVNDSDTTDGFGGWTEYVVIDAAIKAMIKQELDVQALGMQKMAMIERLESVAENRDAGNPACVTDAASTDMAFPAGSGGGIGGSF